ncbi:MFS transporter [Alcanivorax sp. IO_7]|nr:MFS transporter [Alcanivorax sp. IO_7]
MHVPFFPGSRRVAPGRALLGFLAALILLAVNLRTGIVVIGPLADGIGDDLRLDGVALGLLTSLPLLCFAALSLFAPRLGERLGLERALLLALWVLLAGLTLRVPGNYGLMLAGTLMMGAAIAVMNVLTPGLVRQRFPHRVAAVTALYSVVMACGASAAAAFAVPVRDHFGGDWRYPWRPALWWRCWGRWPGCPCCAGGRRSGCWPPPGPPCGASATPGC